MNKIKNAAAILGAIGGSKTSAAKRRSSRKNGLLGGRPKIYLECPKCGMTWDRRKIAAGHICPRCDHNTEE